MISRRSSRRFYSRTPIYIPVESSSPSVEVESFTTQIIENGDHTYTADEGKAYNPLTISVNVPSTPTNDLPVTVDRAVFYYDITSPPSGTVSTFSETPSRGTGMGYSYFFYINPSSPSTSRPNLVTSYSIHDSLNSTSPDPSSYPYYISFNPNNGTIWYVLFQHRTSGGSYQDLFYVNAGDNSGSRSTLGLASSYDFSPMIPSQS